MNVLDLRNLTVTFRTRSGARSVRAVRGIDLSIERGEIHALVGESGSGKSVTSKAVIQLLPGSAQVTADRLVIDGTDYAGAKASDVRRLRGTKVAMVFQEPGKHLNPSFTIGSVMNEMLARHVGYGRREARRRAEELMELVELNQGASVLDAYPHELSGGMKQRALIALAISCGPSLLLADEPTTALDVIVQRQILQLIERLRKQLGMAVLFISHDLGVVQSIADIVSVMYAGRIVDRAASDELFSRPLHPYTELLLDAIPEISRRGERLEAIPGKVPDATAVPAGCAFHPRCPIAGPECRRDLPELIAYRPNHRVACHRVEHIFSPGNSHE
ncbi:MAG: ABC transporter ATP-binding protein [Spirochaetia bacterium]